MSQSSVKFGYLTSLAFRNIWNHKRHMFIIIFGFTISVSMLLSVNTWSNTSENLAINAFLDSQDFQAYIYSAQQPEDIDLLQEDLRNNPLVGFYTTAYATFGLFNTEGKSNTYQCLPEDTQLNTTSPVSITNAFLTNQSTLDRISFMFNIEGNFTLDDDGIILSLHQAQELSEIYGQEITVGDHVNITIAKHIPIPAYGQNMIESFQGTYFNESYMINGIYTVREGISILQSAVPIEWLSDSIIFNSELLSENDREEMTVNEVPYLLLIKFDREIITEDGLDEVVDKMLLFSETVKKDYPSAFIYILDDPLISLMNAYSRAAFSIVFMIPIIMIGVIMTVFTINIVIQSRESEVALLRDRGADTVQIVTLFIIEFAIVSFIGTIIGIALSFPIAALIPSFASTGFSATTFKLFISNLTITWWFMIVVIVVLTLVLVGYASVKIFWEISLRHKNS
ncbi:MAG: FtsX-like permease family protein, partial [Candidatus Heimdallarchaeota archaeon]